MRPDEAAGSLDPKLAAATTAAPPATVKMKGIRKNFGAVRALQGVDLDLVPREILGLVGDNAAGKSTLMKILSGALRADAGEMFVEGRPAPIHSPRDARNLGIEMVHQDFALCKNIWTAGNIYMGKEIRRRGIGRFLGLLDKPKMLRGSGATCALRLNTSRRSHATATTSATSRRRC